MSFGTTTKATKQKKLANVDANTLNSNQEAIPVAYAAGRRRISCGFLSPCYNVTAKKVKSDEGSKGGGSQVTGHKYYVDILLDVCVCGHTPVDAITTIIVDSQVAWTGRMTRADHPIYAPITVKHYGEARFYWGTLDQGAMDWFSCHFAGTDGSDGSDPQPARTDEHPPYKGICYLVWRQFFMGQDRTQMPNIEVVIERPSLWFDDQPAPTVDTRGVNAIALLYEQLADDWFGAGYDPAGMDKAGWLSAYQDAEGAGLRFSPLVTSATGIRSLVAQLFEYYDGWLCSQNGLLLAGFWRHGQTDTSNLPVLDYDVISEEPELTSAGFGDTVNQVTVIYSDQTRYFNDTSLVRFDESNRRIVGELRPVSLQRPWIVDAAQAMAYACEYLHLNSQPAYTGPVRVKRESAGGRSSGRLVKVSSDSYGLTIICRVIEQTYPEDRSGVTELQVESERGLYEELFIPTPPPRVQDFRVVAATIEHARVVTLPSGLKTNSNVQLSILAERSDPTLTGFRVYLSRDGESYDPLLGDAAFAVRGTVVVSYPPDTPALDQDGIIVQLDSIDADQVISQSDVARDDNTLLLWVGSEIMSVGEVQALGNGQYRLEVHRALYGTAQGSHPQNAEVWIHRRSEISILEASGTIEKGAIVYLKLPTHNATADQPLDGAAVELIQIGFDSAVGAAFGLDVETYAEAGQDGQVKSYIQATWENFPDQGITNHDVAIKQADAGDNTWLYDNLSEASKVWTVTPATVYQVKIRSRNQEGEPSSWSEVVTILSATTSDFSITRLELVGQGNDHTFNTPDAHFDWGLVSPSRAQNTDTEDTATQDGLYDPRFQDFLIGVRATDTRVIVWGGPDGSKSEATPSHNFRYTENVQAFGQPTPRFDFGVAGRLRDGSVTPWAWITVNNPAPAPVPTLAAVGTPSGAFLNWPKSPDHDNDVVNYRIFEARQNNFGAAAYYDAGKTLTLSRTGIKDASGTPLFYWVCAQDSFGSLSTPSPVATAFLDSIPAGNVANFAEAMTNWQSNIVIFKTVIFGDASPGPGSAAWSSGTITCHGQNYTVQGGSATNGKFVYWIVGEANFRTSDTDPSIAPGWDPLNNFQVGVVQDSHMVQAWFASPNGVFVSLYAMGIVTQRLLATEAYVTSLNIAGNAVTFPGAYQGTNTVFGNWTVVCQFTKACSGAPAIIWGGYTLSNDQGSGITAVDWKVVRANDGLVLDSDDYTARDGTNNQPLRPVVDPVTLVGDNTYQLWLRGGDHPNTGWTTPKAATARRPTLIHIEFLR